MACSPARLAANRANAKLSTGPKSDQGKATSRRNSLKHGLSGAGVVLPPDDVAKVDALSAELVEEMKPRGAMGRVLLRQFAIFSARIDRCEQQEAAARARRVRDAEKDRDVARRAEVNAIAANLENDPDGTVRTLLQTPEGIDGLIESWQEIRGHLDRPRRFAWGDWHAKRVDYLMGRHPGMHPPSPLEALSQALRGDFSMLGEGQGAGLRRDRRMAWAREQLGALIDAEVAELRAVRASIDAQNEATDRAEAADRALFDPSPEGQLARKYQAAAERGLFRALREYRAHERQTEVEAPPEPAAPAAPAAPSPRVSKPAAAAARPAPAPPVIAAPTPPPSRTKPTPRVGGPAIGRPDASTIRGFA
ncbi:hypothetical protein TA3x_002437 [Tundrisphaera sp. TA3]|uniref:hypothetical protein n=1 Tax=Tundrisphaera sp. TA3 TaxID=3435775 RepID=UPI003EBF3AB2